MTLEEAHQRIADAAANNATSLDLSGCTDLRDLLPLAEQSHLQSLKLTGCKGVSDLRPLSGLSELISLDLTLCQETSDITPLSPLTKLQALSLYWCSKVEKIGALKGMTGMKFLSLFGCPLITDLSPLAEMVDLTDLLLTECRGVSDLAPLTKLTALRILDFTGCVDVADLTPLSTLEGIEHLEISVCEKIVDLVPLQKLPRLKYLKMFGTGVDRLPSWWMYAPSLTTVIVDGLVDVPEELQSQRARDNCLPRLRAWWNDQQGGAVAEPEVKMFLLGNGWVGKTQLCRFVQGLDYDPAVKTTHGVQLVRLPRDEPPVRAEAHLNVWDFGGQDIYHGTHALFLKSRAIFLILWTPELEAQALAWRPDAARDTAQDYEDRPRPLAYWLEYVRELGGHDLLPIIVRSQCDEREQEQLPPEEVLAGINGARVLSFSAKTGYGGEALLGAVRDAVAELHRRHPPHTFGSGWITVRNRCHALREAGTRTLEPAEFEALCRETGGVSDPAVLLGVLHLAGVVFHRRDLFGGKIIVDQSWALEAIYTVFHREHCVPHLRGDGTFTRRELDRIAWGEVRRHHGGEPFSKDEQELFLSMMVSCGICFRWRENVQGEQVYLAPELLPSREAVREYLAGRVRASDLPRQKVVFRYRFLHEGVVRELLSAVGSLAQDAAVYWRSGLWLYEGKSDAYAVIEARETPAAGAGAGEIELAVYGDNCERLTMTLFQVVMGLNTEPSDIDGFAHHIVISLDESHSPFANLSEGSFTSAPAPRGAPPAVFISYAWGDETSAGRQRTTVVERLCARLGAKGFQVVRDTLSTRTGDSISEFMKRFGTADRVVAIISDKYLRSVACMTELHSVWQTSQQDPARFQQRVRPLVLDDAKIDRTLDRLARAEYWQAEHAGLLAAQQKLGDNFGVEDQRELKLIGSFAREVSDMLRWLNDELMPRRFEDDVDFDPLIELLGASDA